MSESTHKNDLNKYWNVLNNCLLIALSTLWIRQQLVPRINQLRDAELAGDAAAGARFATLHRVSVIINMVQLLALVVLLLKY